MDRGHLAKIFVTTKNFGLAASHPKDGIVMIDSIVSPSLYWGIRTHTE